MEVPSKTLNDYSEIDNCSDKELDATITRLLKDEKFSENLDIDMESYYKLHFLEGMILSDDIYDSLSNDEKKKLYAKSLVLNKEKESSEVFSYCPEKSFSKEIKKSMQMAVLRQIIKKYGVLQDIQQLL